MIDFIYKPKGERIWRWKFRQEPKHGKIQDVSLGTSDKRCAEERQKKLRKEKEQECAGLIAPKAVREAAQRNLAEHLADFDDQERQVCGNAVTPRAGKCVTRTQRVWRIG